MTGAAAVLVAFSYRGRDWMSLKALDQTAEWANKQDPIAIVVLFWTGPRRFLYRNTVGRLTSEEVCDTTGGFAERFFVDLLWSLRLRGYSPVWVPIHLQAQILSAEAKVKDFASAVESFKADNHKLQVTYLPPLSMTVFGLGHKKKERSPALAIDRDTFFFSHPCVLCRPLT